VSVDPWFLVAVSVGSVLGFVFFSTAIVAQFGQIAHFPSWSRACVVPRAATTGGRALNSLVYALMTPGSLVLAMAVIADALRVQNLAVALLGFASVLAIAGWLVFLLRSQGSDPDRVRQSSPGPGE